MDCDRWTSFCNGWNTWITQIRLHGWIPGQFWSAHIVQMCTPVCCEIKGSRYRSHAKKGAADSHEFLCLTERTCFGGGVQMTRAMEDCSCWFHQSRSWAASIRCASPPVTLSAWVWRTSSVAASPNAAVLSAAAFVLCRARCDAMCLPPPNLRQASPSSQCA